MYIIARNEPAGNGETAYVNQPGSASSYTTNPARAQRFPSYESAKRHCCGNEHPVKRSEVLEY
jgi:hypothetical protein